LAVVFIDRDFPHAEQGREAVSAIRYLLSKLVPEAILLTI
jgi:hypothetical protein